MCCEHHPQAGSCIQCVPIFHGLTVEEVTILQQVTHSRSYNKGDYIFREGEPSHTLYVVHEGLIKISKLSAEGKEQIIRLLFPGDFFGQLALLEKKNQYAHAEVLEKTTICQIHKEDFIPVLERNPDMAIRFMMALSERIYQADEWIGTISLMEVERRLARALLIFYERSQKGKQPFALPISKKDFASLIGTTPETLSRKLVHFESLNLLTLAGRKEIQIKNPQGLADVVGLN